jgi:hypothetical protein
MSQLVKTKRQANFSDLEPSRGSSNKKTLGRITTPLLKLSLIKIVIKVNKNDMQL